MIVDKFILRRPSLKELGVENKVTVITNSDNYVDAQLKLGYTIQDNWQSIDTIVNWDKVPNIVIGVVGHEEDGKLNLYSAKYICTRMRGQDIYDADKRFKLVASKDSLEVTKFTELLKCKDMYEYGYDFDASKYNVLPVRVEPRMIKDNKVKYRTGRVFIPAMTVKNKYKDLLVSDFTGFTGTLEANDITTAKPQYDFDNPIAIYVMEGYKYLLNNVDAFNKEVLNITEKDKLRFETDNVWRIIGAKLSLGEIDVPIG